MTNQTDAPERAPNIDEIIDRIKNSCNEVEIKELTEKYSRSENQNGLSNEIKEKIRITGITRWGELLGLEGLVIGFEINKDYDIKSLIREMAMVPTDGIYRVRSIFNEYADSKVKTMGLSYGFKSAFKVVFKTGKELYGNRFNEDMAKVAFMTVANYKGIERYVDNISKWFSELTKTNEK